MSTLFCPRMTILTSFAMYKFCLDFKSKASFIVNLFFSKE